MDWIDVLAVLGVVLTLVGVAMVSPWAVTSVSSPRFQSRMLRAGHGFLPMFAGLGLIAVAATAEVFKRLLIGG